VNLPLHMEILVATLDNLARLMHEGKAGTEPAHVQRGDDDQGLWSLCRTTWTLTLPNRVQVRLNRTEATFLATLAATPGEPVSRAKVIESLGHGLAYYDSRRLDTMVSRLRSKVANQSSLALPVRAIHAVGYAVVTQVALQD
jgi:DNA-binding response OmpR family regulator